MARKKRIIDQIREERDAPVKKRGRPKGSTNKKKELPTEEIEVKKFKRPVSDTTYYIYEWKKKAKKPEFVTYTIYKDGLSNLLEQLLKGSGTSEFVVKEVKMKDDPAHNGSHKNVKRA